MKQDIKIFADAIDAINEFSTSPAWNDYCAILEEIHKLKPEIAAPISPRLLYTDEFFHNAELFVRYGPFRKIGKGSSRTAYTFDADPRYVLKFAHNMKGLRQNQTEIKNVKLGYYRCLVRVLSYDPEGILIVEDLCRESTYSDWYRTIGLSPNMLSKIVRVIFERKGTDPSFALQELLEEVRNPQRAAEILKKTTALDDEFTLKDHPKIVSCVENMIAVADGEQGIKWARMYDLFRFYCDHGLGAMIPEELLYVDQWGVKSGMTSDEDSLIIIDPGVDEDFRPFVGKNGRVR